MIKKIIIFSLIITTMLFSEVEKFYVNPYIGSFSKDKKFFDYISKHQKIKFYNKEIIYSSSLRLLENKFLIIKAIELSQINNDKFKKNINDIDSAYKKIDSILKAASIEENVKKVLSTSALIGFTTDTIGNELSTSGTMLNILKAVLEQDSIKKILVDKFSYMTNENYDIWVTSILSTLEFSLTWIEDSAWKNISSVEEFNSVFSKSFSKFVSVPLALYETFLKSINIGSTIGAIFSLNKAKNLSMSDRMATSFLFDYVNIFKGDINRMRSFLQNNYKYWYLGDITYDGDLRIVKKTSKYGNTININSFFDLFYWYIFISDFNNKDYDIKVRNRTHLLNIVKGARKALDYIENYGNGGNFRFSIKYKINEYGLYPEKNIDIIKNNFFNQLYYMPQIDTKLSNKDLYLKFYGFNGYSPNLSLPNYCTKNIKLNTLKVNKITNIILYKSNNKTEHKVEYIYKKLSPKITISCGSKMQVKNIGSFYLPYGYFPSIDPKKTTFGQSAFIKIYNKGYLNIYEKEFHPNKPAIAKLLSNLIYGYINGYKNKHLWKYCTRDKLCINNLKSPISYIKRSKLIDILVKKYNLNKYKVIRPFKRKGHDWSNNGKILFQLNIINGDSKTEKMNGEENVSNIELLTIIDRLKSFLVKKGGN